MQKTPLELPALYIGAQPLSGIDLIGGGFSNGSSTFLYSDHYGVHSIVDTTFTTLQATIQASEQEYASRISQLPQTIEHELAATRLEGSTAPLPPADAIIRELGVRHTLLLRKTAEFHGKTAIANSFYGVDPIGRSVHEFHPRASTMGKSVDSAMQAWIASYRAAYDARLLSQTIQLLNQQSVNVQNFLRAVQANDQARMAAEQQAQRVAADLARINAQAEAQAREQARLAALAQAQRLANEQARVAAEAAARHIAAEQARLEAQAEVQRQTELLHLERQQAQEHARLQPPTFANSGPMAAIGPVFAGATGSISTNPATSLALRNVLRAAVSAAFGALATAPTPIIVGFAALLVPSRLGNGDLYSVSVPLSELAPDLSEDLYGLAAVQGAVNLRVTLGSRTIGKQTQIVVATTDGVSVPSTVPVRLAQFDPQKKVYVSTSTGPQSVTTTWTPVVASPPQSTEFPAVEVDPPVYEGATVTPVEGRIDAFPQLDQYSFGGFITVFPIDSGIPPIFTMFRDRRDDPGVASGFGQEISGVWLGAASQREGAAIPSQIADQLRGREFSTFGDFRKAFWKAVASDLELSQQFKRSNRLVIQMGRAPFPIPNEQVGGRNRFEIHHVKPLKEHGAVYDIDNLRILTPKRHIEIHAKNGDY